MIQVINIKKEYEPILCFLYPDYTIADSLSGNNKIIVHHDVTSKAEREKLDYYYNDCIFISTQIFDVVWDEEVIKQKCVEYANRVLKNRKKKIVAEPETLVSDCISFMYNLSDVDDDSITELFDVFGSARFTSVFFSKAESIPVPKLVAAMSTFIHRIVACSENSSVYYKSKASLYKKKIQSNVVKALDNYILRDNDVYGLSACKFFVDLFE